MNYALLCCTRATCIMLQKCNIYYAGEERHIFMMLLKGYIQQAAHEKHIFCFRSNSVTLQKNNNIYVYFFIMPHKSNIYNVDKMLYSSCNKERYTAYNFRIYCRMFVEVLYIFNASKPAMFCCRSMLQNIYTQKIPVFGKCKMTYYVYLSVYRNVDQLCCFVNYVTTSIHLCRDMYCLLNHYFMLQVMYKVEKDTDIHKIQTFCGCRVSQRYISLSLMIDCKGV